MSPAQFLEHWASEAIWCLPRAQSLGRGLLVFVTFFAALGCKSDSNAGPTGHYEKATARETQGVLAAQTSAGKGQGNVPAAEPIRLPGVVTAAPWLGDASKVVALKSHGSVLIVAAGLGWLRWFDGAGTQLGERLGEGAPQVLEAIDVDGDGTKEIVFGRGMGLGAAKAPASLEVLRISRASVTSASLALPTTSRQQVVAVAVAAAVGPGAGHSLWVASFVSKYLVQVSRYHYQAKNTSNLDTAESDGIWSFVEKRGTHRVVADMVVLADGTLVIARMYGDDADQPGGVYVLPQNGKPRQLPSTRGARALLALPKRKALAMADGWNKYYRKKARGLVTIAGPRSDGWHVLAGVEVAHIFGFSELRLGNVTREKGSEILAAGNGPVVVVLPDRPDLLYKLGDVKSLDAAAVNLSGDERDEVVIAGPAPSIWTPH